MRISWHVLLVFLHPSRQTYWQYMYKPAQIRATYTDQLNLFRQCNIGSCLVAGDFNTHHSSWGCHYENQQSAELISVLDDCHLSILNNSEPTYISHRGRDLTLTTPDIAFRSSWNTLNDTMGSDDFPVLIQLAQGTSNVNPIPP